MGIFVPVLPFFTIPGFANVNLDLTGVSMIFFVGASIQEFEFQRFSNDFLPYSEKFVYCFMFHAVSYVEKHKN